MKQKRDFRLRFAVGSENGPQSSIWIVWSNHDEVYAAHRSRAGMEKFSFHSSGVCRRAFTSQYGRPPTLEDRAMQKWIRAPTPAIGLERRSRVLSIITPTDHLSSVKPSELPKTVVWLKPRPFSATVVELGFTNEREHTVLEAFRATPDETLLIYHRLPSGEAVTIAAGHVQWREKGFMIPASAHQERDAIVANVDPHATGRPLRISILGSARDGEVLTCWEFGGYYADPGDPAVSALNIKSHFDRKRVIATEATVPLPWKLGHQP